MSDELENEELERKEDVKLLWHGANHCKEISRRSFGREGTGQPLIYIEASDYGHYALYDEG